MLPGPLPWVPVQQICRAQKLFVVLEGCSPCSTSEPEKTLSSIALIITLSILLEVRIWGGFTFTSNFNSHSLGSMKHA